MFRFIRFTFLKVLVLILFMLPKFSLGQGNYEDVVYLKNGSVIRGIITEQVPNESITIRTADRNVFVFKMDEVLKFTKEEKTSPEKEKEIKPDPVVEKTYTETTENDHKGFTDILEFTFGRDQLRNHSGPAITGNEKSNPQMSVGIQNVFGYSFSYHFSTGIGTGLHFYPGMVLVPVFADFRYNFSKGKATPFISVGAGYSFTYMEVFGFISSKDYYGGVIMNPAFGVRFNARSGKAFILSLGYRYQEANIYTHNDIFNNDTPYRTDGYQNQTFGYTNFKLGFVF